MRDVRLALRQFGRAPILSAVVVLMLALCIGATTAVYGVTRRLLLAPLPYPDGNRIVSLETRSAGDGEFHFGGMDPELARIWAARTHATQDLAVMQLRKRYPVGIADDGTQDSVAVGFVTASFLPMLRVRPSLGRGFTAEDGRRGAPAVALLGDRLWRSRYGSDAGVIGRAITVDGVPRTIVGVVPREVAVPTQARNPLDVMLPLDLASSTTVDGVFARLRPGVSSAMASHELQAILRTLPDTGSLKGLHAEAQTAPEQLDPRRRRAVEVLFTAAGALLLIGCADVAGLLLMRGWARRREFAVRQSLGAWRGRLTRQMLTESLLLAAPSGALGLLVAWLGLRALVAVRPRTLDILDSVQLDGATFVWTTVAAVTTGILFGVGPALLAGGRSVGAALRSGVSGAGTGRAAGRAHATLVVGQIALSLMFLAAAGVLARSFVSLARTSIGYDPVGLFELSVRGAPATPTAGGPPARGSKVARDAVVGVVREALAATPGVREVAIGTLPHTRIEEGPSAVDGPTGVRPVDESVTGFAYVGPEYFRVARIPILRGRGFDASPAVADGEVIINQGLARRLWPERDAIGARLRLGSDADAEWLTVVGVAGDVRMPGMTAELYGLQMYRPSSAAQRVVRSLVLRARGDSASLRATLSRAIEGASVGVRLRELVTAESTLEIAFGGPRLAVALFGAFAVLAVALAAMGLFGIIAYAVARRTREIGVRVALGADPAALTRAILGQSLRFVAIGCAVGLLGAYAASRALTALVYEVSPADPAVLGGAVALLAVIALAASAIPVRRALRVDPVRTLRAE